MDTELPWMERPSSTLVPIKSSLSLILSDLQVWSNSACPMSNPYDDEDTHKLDAFAQSLVKKHSRDEQDKRLKKSRQVFTYSRPPSAGVGIDFHSNDVVYESTGGQGPFGGVEPNLCEEIATKQACQPPLYSTGSAPDEVTSQIQLSEGIQRACDSDALEISYPSLTLPKVQSECELRSCFPNPARPSLLYAVSRTSLPVLKCSSVISRQGSPLHKETDRESSIPLHPIQSSCSWLDETNISGVYDLTLRRPILIKRHCKYMLIKCQNLEDDLARKIAKSVQRVTEKARRGKFMSYAKFDSSFKLSEVFYGDNCSRLSRVTSSAEPRQSRANSSLTDDFTKLSQVSAPFFGRSGSVGGMFDDNLSEAMTAIKSLSSVTSVSRVTEMCRLALDTDSKTSGVAFKYDHIRSDITGKADSKPNGYVDSPVDDRTEDVSSISANSGVSLLQAVTTARNRQLSKLQDAIRNRFQIRQKETDLWSNSTSAGSRAFQPAPKRLVHVGSPTCIFRVAADGPKFPTWHLKSDQQRTDCRMELINEFIFKAHNYLHVRDRPNLQRCYFQQPTYRVVDEGVQFPEVLLPTDRTANVKDTPENQIPDPKNTDLLLPVGVEIDQASLMVPSEMNTSSMKVRTETEIQPDSAHLNVIVACENPLYSTSEFQTVSSEPINTTPGVPITGTENESSLNLPAPPSPNKYQISSSEYHTASTVASFHQPRHRKFCSKLPPVVEHRSPKCCKRNPRASRLCRSYRALCDKRKIKIEYRNGRYAVLKEKDKPRRRTIWSILTSKATRLLNSVVRRKRHQTGR